MYTNIDTNYALAEFEHFFESNPICEPIYNIREILLEAIKIIMQNNLFKFGDTFWKQKNGTAMGCPPGPSYATIYFGIHELKLLSKFQPFFCLYRRYIDNAFLIWRQNENHSYDQQKWNEFKLKMNNFGILKWKIEEPTNSVIFLDMIITIKNNRLLTKIYKKEKNPYLYLPPSSAHTPGIIKGTIYGMLFCYYILTSDLTDFYPQVTLFFHRLINRGYQAGYIRPIFEEAFRCIPLIAERRKKKLENNEESDRLINTCFLHVPFHPSNPSQRLLQTNFRNIMLTKKGAKLPEIINIHGQRIGTDRLIICNHRAKNIRDCLFPQKFERRPGLPVSQMIANL